jgi:hypothetical protein
VAEQTSGIELMRRRMERARRQPPPPRRARAAAGEGEVPPAAPEPAPAPAPAPAARPRRPAPAPAPLRLGPDVAPVNLAIRVRKPLDDRLADLIHDLRREGVRTSKVELIEMLLWELPEGERAGVRERLRRFRDWAPRGAGAPLSD